MKKRDFLYLGLIIILSALAVCRPSGGVIETRVDTVVVRDTIRDTVPVEVERRVVRTDTVWLRQAGDTIFVEVAVPVERKVYQTERYRAVVEGFRPSLAEIDIYGNTIYINRERRSITRPKRWGIGLQAGYGYGAGGFQPYVGIGVQYSLFCW